MSSAPASQDFLTFDRTVLRTLVHRSTVTEVFITDSRRLDGGWVLVAAQWPRDHALHHPDVEGYSDPVLLIETIRQASIYIAHEYFDVPFTHRFIFCDLEFHIEDFGGLRGGSVPQKVILDGRMVPAAAGSGRRFDAQYEVRVTVDGLLCARAAARVLAVENRLYAALRGPLAGVPVSDGGHGSMPQPGRLFPPAEVGRLRAENVLLCQEPSGGPGVYRLCLTPGHPGYFEHPSDHVPGMALLEAVRQAAHRFVYHEDTGSAARGHTTPPTVLTALRIAFGSFANLDESVVITAKDISPTHPGQEAATRVELTAVQECRVVAQASLDYGRRDAGGLRGLSPWRDGPGEHP